MSQLSTPGTSTAGAGPPSGPALSRIPTLSAGRSGANSRLPSPPVSPGLSSPSTPPTAPTGMFASASTGGGAGGGGGSVSMGGTWTAGMVAQTRERMVSSGSTSSLTSAVNPPGAPGGRSQVNPPLVLPRPDSIRTSFTSLGPGAARPPSSSASAGGYIGVGIVTGGIGGGGGVGSPAFSGGMQDANGGAAPGGVDAAPGAGGTGSPASRSSIQVAVRVRPLCDKERLRGDRAAWAADEDGNVGLLDANTGAFTPKHRFDTVFGPDADNSMVATAVALPLVAPALYGINGTIFAYGVTSSGKTHTMMGTEMDPGVVPRVIRELFAQISAASPGTVGGAATGSPSPGGSRCYTVRMSVMEIYNEVLNDLLDPTRINLKVREDARSGLVLVEGLTEQQVASAEQALDLISRGDHNRKVSSTAFNEDSSRSHTITRIVVESTLNANTNANANASPSRGGVANGGGSLGGDRAVARRTTACLSLIDLAGSESARAVMSKGQRMEGSFINRSLLTLGTVIHKLAGGVPGHVPFRDSKLTRLLQPSLSGPGARVAVVCNITPAAAQSDETANTLKFASRAKLVQVTARTNEILDERTLLRRYQKEVADLKRQLAEARRLLAAAGVSPSAAAAAAADDAAGGVSGSAAGPAGLGRFAPSAAEAALMAAVQVERDARREVEMEGMMMKIKLAKLQAFLEDRGVNVDDLFMNVASPIVSKGTAASTTATATPLPSLALAPATSSSPTRLVGLEPLSVPASGPKTHLVSDTSPAAATSSRARLFASASPSSGDLRNSDSDPDPTPNRLDRLEPLPLGALGDGADLRRPSVMEGIEPSGLQVQLHHPRGIRHAISTPRLSGPAGVGDSPGAAGDAGGGEDGRIIGNGVVGGSDAAGGGGVRARASYSDIGGRLGTGPSLPAAMAPTGSQGVGEAGGAGPWPVWSEEEPSERASGRMLSVPTGPAPAAIPPGSIPLPPIATPPGLRAQVAAAMSAAGSAADEGGAGGGQAGPQAGRVGGNASGDLRGSDDSGSSPGGSMSVGSEVDVDDAISEGLMAQIRDMISEAQLSTPTRPGQPAEPHQLQAGPAAAAAGAGVRGLAGGNLQGASAAGATGAATATAGFRRTDPCIGTSPLPPNGSQAPPAGANGRFTSTGSYAGGVAASGGGGGAFDGSIGGGGGGPASSCSLYRRSTTISTASSSFGAGLEADMDQDLEMQVLLADREVLNDQLMATEKENERLTAQLAELRRQLGTYKTQLGTYEQLTRQAASELGEIRRLKEAFQARLQRENDALRAQLAQLGVAPAVPATTTTTSGAGALPGSSASTSAGGAAASYGPITPTGGAGAGQQLSGLVRQCQQPQLQPQPQPQPQQLQMQRPGAYPQVPAPNQRHGVQSMAPFGSPAPITPSAAPGMMARAASAPGAAGNGFCGGGLPPTGGSPTRASPSDVSAQRGEQRRHASGLVGAGPSLPSRQQSRMTSGPGGDTVTGNVDPGGGPAVDVQGTALPYSRSSSLQSMPSASFGAAPVGPDVRQPRQPQPVMSGPGQPGVAQAEVAAQRSVSAGGPAGTEGVLVRLQQHLMARMQARDSGGGAIAPPFAATAGAGVGGGPTAPSVQSAAAATAVMGV